MDTCKLASQLELETSCTGSVLRTVLLQNFYGLIGSAMKEEFQLLWERDQAQQAEQEPVRDALDDELDIPVNEVERWRRLARKRFLAFFESSRQNLTKL